MCDMGQGEMATLYNESTPVARKSHRCCECSSEILPGEKYERITGLWDDFMTFKTCLFCSGVRDQARADRDLALDEGFPFEQLWECVGMDYAFSI